MNELFFIQWLFNTSIYAMNELIFHMFKDWELNSLFEILFFSRLENKKVTNISQNSQLGILPRFFKKLKIQK